MSVYDRFNRLLQGRAPVPRANIVRPYQTPQGITPPMALPRPTPPQSPMLANQQLSPLMQQVLKNAQASRMTPKPGQVGLPTPATAAAGQPAPEMTFGQKLMQPRTQGMLGAAAAGLEASGWQDRPVSLGQVLGRMGTAGTKAYTAAEDRQTKLAASLAAAQRQKRLDEAKSAYDAEMLELKRLEVEGASGKAAKVASEKMTDREIEFAKQFRAESKPFKEAMLAFEKISANALSKRPSGSTDIAMIFNFMKSLDPESVVRGQEYEAAAGAGSLIKSLGVRYNRLLRGEDEKLPDQVRKDFYQTALETFQPFVESQIRAEETISGQAKAFGLNDKNIIPKSLAPKVGSERFPHVVYSEQEILNLPAGEYFVLNGNLGVTE